MRFSTLILALFAGWWIGTGCDRAPTCSICGATKWTRFSPTNECFSVIMPLEPTISTRTANTAAGPFPVYFFTAEPSKGYAFAVSHNSFPSEIDMKDTELLLDKKELWETANAY